MPIIARLESDIYLGMRLDDINFTLLINLLDHYQADSFLAASVLDSDWKNNSIFATCSTDKSILVCKVGEEAPLKKFTGHNKDVNAIKWDPQGELPFYKVGGPSNVKVTKYCSSQYTGPFAGF